MSNVREIKTLCLVRVPPGDRWRAPDGTEIFDSLTAGLEFVFQRSNAVDYRLSAREGKVWILTTEELPPIPQKKFSIYGDE